MGNASEYNADSRGGPRIPSQEIQSQESAAAVCAHPEQGLCMPSDHLEKQKARQSRAAQFR
jgi:hypothetical protein